MTVIAVRPASAIKREQAKNQQFTSLDGLRGLAIVLVVWCHLEFAYSAQTHTAQVEHVLGGFAYSGVVLFFVLSGFLLFLPYARAILSNECWPSAARFYMRRGLRILPSYYAVFLVFPLFLYLFRSGMTVWQVDPVQAILGLTLLYDMHSDTYHLITQFNGPLWSLALEWQFYLLLPWLALAIARLSTAAYSRLPLRIPRHWSVCGGLAVLSLGGLAVRALAASAHYTLGYPAAQPDHGWLSALLHIIYGARGKYIEVFALGMLTSVVYVVCVEHGRLPTRWRAIAGWAAVVVALAGLAACLPWAKASDRLYEVRWLEDFPPRAAWVWGVLGDEVLGVCYSALLIGVLLVPAMMRMFSLAPLRILGRISYSAYLWHMIWIPLFVRFDSPLQISAIGLMAIIILLWSLIAYALIERPFLRLQRRFRTDSLPHRAADGRQD